MDGPGVILYDENGVALAVLDGAAIPTSTPGLILLGSDGGTSRYLFVDSAGRASVVSPQLPAALVGGRLDVNAGSWLGSTAPTVGQKAMADSLPVVLASDQSAVTVAGSVTANIGTTNGLALDATLTGGTQKSIARGGAKGATAAADVTSTAEGADHQGLDVQVYHGGTAINPAQIRALTASDVVSVEVNDWLGSTAPTVGQKTSANSIPTVLASDQPSIPVTADQGGPAANADAWPILVSDGVDTVGISTVGADKALKVDVIQTVGSSGGGASFGAAFPAVGSAAGFTDGTNMRPARVFDGDSGGGTELVLGAILRKAASGGSVEAGTSTDPLRVDPTGTTPQPVSGTVTANIGTSGSLALDATLTGGTQKAVIRGGAKGSTAAADVTSTAEGADHQAVDVQVYHGGAAVNPTAIRALTASDVVSAEINDWLGSTAPTVGQKTMANSLPVVISSDQTAIPAPTSGTATLSNVAALAVNGTLLASNASRKGATIHNDSTALLYVKLGATASVTSFTVRLISQAYYEVPFGYTGIIDGIWDAATGNARVTELT